MIRSRYCVLAGAAALALAAAEGSSVPAVAKATITTFFVGTADTIPTAINKDGDIAGTYFDTDGSEGGFFRDGVTGSTVKFQVNGASTTVLDMDDLGLVTGSWTDASGARHCYVRNSNNGRIHPCGPAAASFSQGDAISLAGVFGIFSKPGEDTTQAFIDDFSGSEVTFNVAAGDGSTFASDINDNGVATGDFTDSSGAFHGFFRLSSGNTTTFDAPDSQGTFPSRINDAETIVGNFIGNDLLHHCFVLTSNFVTFDPPGAQLCVPLGINKKGTIAGFWTDSLGLDQGFVRSPGGTIKILNVPKSTETIPRAINNAGLITGSTESTKCRPATEGCGFLRTP